MLTSRLLFAAKQRLVVRLAHIRLEHEVPGRSRVLRLELLGEVPRDGPRAARQMRRPLLEYRIDRGELRSRLPCSFLLRLEQLELHL